MRALAIFLIAVAGCGAEEDLSDLEDFMEKVRLRQEAPAKPAPPLQAPEAFDYRANGRHSPFQPFSRQGSGHQGSAGASTALDTEASRHHLAGHAVEDISMVGTLSRGPVRFGLVRVDGGPVERVGVGDRLGENGGRIHSIGPLAMQLLEVAPDGTGGWAERPLAIALEQPGPGLADGRRP